MTKIKICGMRRPQDIEAANALHPDFAGMILSPGFRRSIGREQARELRALLDPAIPLVGVFVNAPEEEILSFAREGIIQMIQLHGQEDEAQIRQLQKESGLPVVKAFRVRSAEDLSAAAESPADFVLLDSGTGSGQTFDWRLLRDIGREFFLAGGLGPDNLAEAIGRFHPYAVDLSSGAETDGVKDPEKMAACIAAVRGGQ